MPETNSKINWNLILQIVLAIIIVLILYVVTLLILDIDSIIEKSTKSVLPRETTTIVDGYGNASFFADRSYNTFNPYASNFVKIGRSINTHGGSQYTYQFWIKIDNPSEEYFKDLIILLKGDKRKYMTGLYDSKNVLNSKIPDDYVIACPLIKFTDSYKNLRVQFNTRKSPFTTIDINMNPDESILSRRNVTSLMALSKWFMLTFVLEDNYSIATGREDGISFRFYVDDFRYQTNTPSDVNLRLNTLYQNDGDLTMMLNATGKDGNFMKMGNVKYYNYALTDEEVKQTFSNGPPTKDANAQRKKDDQAFYLSAYNKIDVYNY